MYHACKPSPADIQTQCSVLFVFFLWSVSVVLQWRGDVVKAVHRVVVIPPIRGAAFDIDSVAGDDNVFSRSG